MDQPAQADLIVINPSAGTGQIVASFNPGNYPLGVSWSGNDQTLFFAAGTQVQEGGQFPPLAIPSTAQMFTVSPDGGPIGQISGCPDRLTSPTPYHRRRSSSRIVFEG